MIHLGKVDSRIRKASSKPIPNSSLPPSAVHRSWIGVLVSHVGPDGVDRSLLESPSRAAIDRPTQSLARRVAARLTARALRLKAAMA